MGKKNKKNREEQIISIMNSNSLKITEFNKKIEDYEKKNLELKEELTVLRGQKFHEFLEKNAIEFDNLKEIVELIKRNNTTYNDLKNILENKGGEEPTWI